MNVFISFVRVDCRIPSTGETVPNRNNVLHCESLHFSPKHLSLTILRWNVLITKKKNFPGPDYHLRSKMIYKDLKKRSIIQIGLMEADRNDQEILMRIQFWSVSVLFVEADKSQKIGWSCVSLLVRFRITARHVRAADNTVEKWRTRFGVFWKSHTPPPWPSLLAHLFRLEVATHEDPQPIRARHSSSYSRPTYDNMNPHPLVRTTGACLLIAEMHFMPFQTSRRRQIMQVN